MGRAFVDTEAWFALADTSSSTHARTAEAISRYSASLVTTTFVLAELIALIVSRKDHHLAARIGNKIRENPDIALIHPDERRFPSAWQRFQDRPDKTCSLTDCLSFVVIEDLGLNTVISNDHHFRQEGFAVLPERA